MSFPFCNSSEIILNSCTLFIIIFYLLCMGELMICLHFIMVLLIHQIVTCSGSLVETNIFLRFQNESKKIPKIIAYFYRLDNDTLSILLQISEILPYFQAKFPFSVCSFLQEYGAFSILIHHPQILNKYCHMRKEHSLVAL